MLKNFMGVIFNKFLYKKKIIFQGFSNVKNQFWANVNTFKTVNNRKKCAAEVDICKAL